MATRRQSGRQALDAGSGQERADDPAPSATYRVSEAKLIETFLLATHDLPHEEAGSIIGVTSDTIRDWRSAGPCGVDEGLRLRILTFLALRSMQPRSAPDSGPRCAAVLRGSVPLV